MRYIFIILLIVSIANNAYSQNNGKLYNQIINRSELLIIDHRYQEALKEYEQVFNDTGIAFTRDIYNALVCSAKLGDYKRVKKFSAQLAEKGVGAMFFSRNVFKNYYNRKDFKKIVNMAAKVHERFKNNNLLYNDTLNEFVGLDQAYNRIRLTRYADSFDLPDTLEVLFWHNTQNLLRFIKNNGFYTENKVGAYVHDTILGRSYSADIVFLHYLEMGHDKDLINQIKDLYLNKLYDCEIPPGHTEQIIQLANNVFGDTGDYAYKIYQCGLYKMKGLPEPQNISANREKYLLDNIDDYGKKLAFVYSEPGEFAFTPRIIGGSYIDEAFLKESYNFIAKIEGCAQ
ncbi:hypothetical protein [Flavobacterium rhizosphaerae]|uniref:Uncharacterized protein n=1 Tax=Flavobacterium rhizosphaerae TaxID=3163298 RepID=A0ABW8YYY9_9FLAO